MIFVKMNACGNDFMVIDLRTQNFKLNKEIIRDFANYKTSIGFDQLIIIENSSEANIAIRIFNNDGSEALACGNGTRCIAKYIFDLDKTEKVTIATKERILSAYRDNEFISINMGKAKIIEKDIKFNNFSGDLVEIGNLHLILTNLDLDYTKYGPLIENDQRFPNRVNVNFARIENHDLVNLKVWERGAGATLACGSGACASFFLLFNKKLINKEAIIRQKGGDLVISYIDDEIIMKGDANYNYRGII